MTFLELAQMLRQECVVSGTGPASVDNQQGIEKRLVDWVNRAWMEIQRKHRDWSFMAADFDFECIPGVSEYSATVIGLSGGVSWWDMASMTVRLTEADESPLSVMDWAAYRQNIIGTQSSGRPTHVTMSPSMALVLWPSPDQEYRVRGQYYRAPSLMTKNADRPSIPRQYCEAIVYLAMQYYGRQESAPEIYADGLARYKEIMNRMEMDLLPFDMNLGEPLI